METLTLEGIDGQHLWGFVAALGSMLLLDEHAREQALPAPRLHFHGSGTAVLESPIAKNQLAAVLAAHLNRFQRCLEQDLGDLNKPSDFTRDSFQRLAGMPEVADFLSGLACVVGDETFESTLCAANGASHQNLLQSMRDILQLVEVRHIEAALFETWQRTYRVPDERRKQLKLGTRKPTLRLDPADERLYALRLSNPTTTDDFRTELGAQALAIPAYALLPVMPRKQPVTVASKRNRQRVTFSWSLWNLPATLRTARSLVWEGVGPKAQLDRGVFAAFSVDRVSGAKGKLSFAPSTGVW